MIITLKISCKVKANGVPFISISDNGFGMTEKDIKIQSVPATLKDFTEKTFKEMIFEVNANTY